MPSYNRLVLSGTLATGTESFSTSVAIARTSGDNVSDPSALTTWAASIATDMATLAGSAMKQGISATGAIKSVKMYFYPDLGANALSVGEAALNVAGAGTADKPLSTAAVVSLRTGLAGRRYRGRMYWPALAWSVSTAGLFASTHPATLADEMAVFLKAVCDKSPDTTKPRPSVASVAGGFVTPVTLVSVNTVPDTQRSRQDKLVGSNDSVPYVP